MGWRWVLQRTVMDWMPDKKEILAFHISPVHSRFNIGVSSAMTFGFGLMPLNDLSRINLVNLFSKHQPYAFETHPNDFVRLANLAKQEPEIFLQFAIFIQLLMRLIKKQCILSYQPLNTTTQSFYKSMVSQNAVQ